MTCLGVIKYIIVKLTTMNSFNNWNGLKGINASSFCANLLLSNEPRTIRLSSIRATVSLVVSPKI